MGNKLLNLKNKAKSDHLIIIFTTVLLVVFGTIMIFSASYYNSINTYGTPYHFLIAQGKYAVVGFVIFFIVSKINYHIYKELSIAILVVNIFMLVALFTPLGTTVNGATRWINCGVCTIMPGEIAKISMIIFASAYLTSEKYIAKSFKKGVMPLLVVTVVVAGLICLQPNMSTAVTICVIVGGMMFFAGMQYKHMFGLIGLGVLGIFALIFSDKDGYRMKRFTSFRHPFTDAQGDGYQVVQSLLALGSGGLFGVGLGNSIQKNLYLPEPQNDFILAIIGEELGLVGIIVLMIVYGILIYECLKVAIHANDLLGTLIAGGVAIMIAAQVILNIAVVTSSIPPTGVALPFVSYGGNSLWLSMIGVGMVLNISKHEFVKYKS